MEIKQFNENTRSGKRKGYFITVNHKEAIGIIRSLSSQVYFNSQNRDRQEAYTINNEYFTIGVQEILPPVLSERASFTPMFAEVTPTPKPKPKRKRK